MWNELDYTEKKDKRGKLCFILFPIKVVLPLEL